MLQSRDELLIGPQGSGGLARFGATQDYPGCCAHLENVRARWVSARKAQIAHEAARIRNEKFQRLNDWGTLVLAVVTAISAVLVPILGETNPYVIPVTITAAVLTSASKIVEQKFARPEDIQGHQTAVGVLRQCLDHLNVLGGQIHNNLLGQPQIELNEAHETVQHLGGLIEETRSKYPVPESVGHLKQAENEFTITPIGSALTQAKKSLQIQTNVLRVFALVGDESEKAIKSAR